MLKSLIANSLDRSDKTAVYLIVSIFVYWNIVQKYVSQPWLQFSRPTV